MPAAAKSSRAKSPAKVNEKTLELSMPQGVRVVALRLLGDAEVASEALRRGVDAKALHDFRVALRRLRSWLRAFKADLGGAVKKKDLRVLRDIAASTNAGRDADVQLDWLQKASKGVSPKRKRGADWLSAYIAARRSIAGDHLESGLLDQFATVRDHLSAKLSTFEQTVDTPSIAPTLGVAIAARLIDHADALGELLGEIKSVDDEKPAHEGRIAAKRLRYLLEPAAPFVKRGEEVLKTLKSLQDELGALHDAHIFGHLIRDTQIPEAPEDAIAAIGKRARADADKAFRRVKKDWLDGRFARFRRDVTGIAKRLDESYS